MYSTDCNNERFVRLNVAFDEALEQARKSGPSMMALMKRLWPICRSLAGPGIRETYDILGEYVPLKRYQFASGTQVYDWTVPNEWHINDAFIADEHGNRVVDFRKSNLHVVHYSQPVDLHLSLEELEPHLHYLEGQPDLIPYVTSFYDKKWGFCLAYNDYRKLRSGNYHVVIDCRHVAGHLEICEAQVGNPDGEVVLIDTYCDHPSLANNELSGPVTAAFLYDRLSKLEGLRYNYHFVFGVETIGPLCYLSEKGKTFAKNVAGGYVLTCCGDDGPFLYKRTKHGASIFDRAGECVVRELGESGADASAVDFFPWGSNERQYCAPGFDFDIGSLMRSRYGLYPEYHTSGDNLDFVSAAGLASTLEAYLKMVQVIETNQFPVNLAPFGEPQLGRRGLYQPAGKHALSVGERLNTILNCLNYSDGTHDLLHIASKANCSYQALCQVMSELIRAELIDLPAN